jgi:glutamate-1-semialdehyde 2,1-aminomutase
MAVDRVVAPDRVENLLERELARFVEERPRSKELRRRASRSMPGGVPASWMVQLHGHPPVYVDFGQGAYFTDVDGHRYFDTNIADTSMFGGYGPEPVVRAVADRTRRGTQFLQPVEDAIAAAEDLARRYALPKWQFTLSATTANTEAFRLARYATGRDIVLMFEGKYHGHADEMLVSLGEAGESRPEYGGLPSRVTSQTRLVQFNDVEALAVALSRGDVACVVTEPALTNLGVIQPADGFHEVLRRLTRESGTLLVIDETHTQICGPGGLTKRWGLEPDVITLGKSIGGGVPIGAYGMSEALAERFGEGIHADIASGTENELATGGTLFGNALSMAAARAALTEVLTDEVYDRTAALGMRLADGIEGVAEANGLPWRAHRLYARSGYAFTGRLSRNATEAHEDVAPDIYRLLRVFMANRGVWEAIELAGPAISVPATAADVDRYLTVLSEFAEAISG